MSIGVLGISRDGLSYWTNRQLVTSVEFKKMEHKIQRFWESGSDDYRRGQKLVA